MEEATSSSNLEYLCDNLREVRANIDALPKASAVRLVAVSKTKPSSNIMALYEKGHRDFGENYVQELIEKASELPKDIKWHFIGHLQSGKAKNLVRDVSSLYCVETVDSEKIASKLNSAVEQIPREPLNVYVQVCTSNEDTKSGVAPIEAKNLCEYILRECPHLRLKGLMTIGAPDDFSCFDTLAQCRRDISEMLSIPLESLDLSMGMSADYVEAILRGSTSVRVGSTIFGARNYNK
jgi:pyridoxal phosphate enzyme (YggS family)